METLHAYFSSLDTIEWFIDGLSVAFPLLLLVMIYQRINVGAARSDSQLVPLAALASGVALAGLSAFDWLVPVRSTVYVVNAGDVALAVRGGGEGYCLPGKSYVRMEWRFSTPKEVVASAGDGSDGSKKTSFAVGKGEWFVNASPSVVSVDVIDWGARQLDPDAVSMQQSGSVRINLGGGKPFQLYSDMPIDRVSYAQGDIVERHSPLPCPTENP